MDKFLSDRHLTTVFVTGAVTGPNCTIEWGAYGQRLQILASIPPTYPKQKKNTNNPTTVILNC